jgi:hypothetical protein
MKCGIHYANCQTEDSVRPKNLAAAMLTLFPFAASDIANEKGAQMMRPFWWMRKEWPGDQAVFQAVSRAAF